MSDLVTSAFIWVPLSLLLIFGVLGLEELSLPLFFCTFDFPFSIELLSLLSTFCPRVCERLVVDGGGLRSRFVLRMSSFNYSDHENEIKFKQYHTTDLLTQKESSFSMSKATLLYIRMAS